MQDGFSYTQNVDSYTVCETDVSFSTCTNP